MFSSLKLAVPLILSLMGEIFRADGENKTGVGLKLSVLFGLGMTMALISVTRNYMELYHDVVELRYHNVQLRTEVSVLSNEANTACIATPPTVTEVACKTDTPVAESYKRIPVKQTHRPPAVTKQDLLTIING